MRRRGGAEAFFTAASNPVHDSLASVRGERTVIREAWLAAAILEYAGESGADLIAMASHGHGWGQLILGDVADEVVRRSAVPILHYHPPDR